MIFHNQTSSLQNLRKHLIIILLCLIPAMLISYIWVDQPIAAWMNLPENMSFWLFNREITDIGEGAPFIILSLTIFFIAKYLIKNSLKRSNLNWVWIKNWAWQWFCALLVSGIIAHIIKFVVGRQRPHVSKTFEDNIFVHFNHHWHWQSFPSGHSQTLFTTLVFLILIWPKARWYLFVVFIYLSMTRALTQAHFVSDVLGGAYVGYAGALITIFWFNRRSKGLASEPLWKNLKNHSSSESL